MQANNKMAKGDIAITIMMTGCQSLALVIIFSYFMHPPLWARIFEVVGIWGMLASTTIKYTPKLRQYSFGVASGIAISCFMACVTIIIANWIVLVI